jgi:hypothetical protein
MLNRRRRSAAPALAIALLATALTACSDDGVSPNPTPATLPAANFQRLLVTDGTAATGRLVALHNDSTVQTFSLAEPASYVYATASGRFAAVHQRTANRVNFFDAGVWVDGTTGYRRAARAARLPAHRWPAHARDRDRSRGSRSSWTATVAPCG